MADSRFTIVQRIGGLKIIDDNRPTQGLRFRPVQTGGQAHAVVRHDQCVGSAIPLHGYCDFAAASPGFSAWHACGEGVLECIGHQFGYKQPAWDGIVKTHLDTFAATLTRIFSER
jgi:hypothetical protein